MDEDVLQLIDRLKKTCSDQVKYYEKLIDIVQRISGQLAVSRGDLSGVMPLFEEKKKILNSVIELKNSSSEDIKKWCSIKDEIDSEGDAEELNRILKTLQERMQVFLESEDQIEQYIKPVLDNVNQSADKNE